MAQTQSIGRRYIKSFVRGFFVAVPVTITFLDRVACIARVEGASMQPSLNPEETRICDIVLLNHWSIRNYEVQRGDIVSLVTISYKKKYVKIPHGHVWVEGDHHGHSFDSNAFGPCHLLTVFYLCWSQNETIHMQSGCSSSPAPQGRCKRSYHTNLV
ncbi:mitochondrial inner membrane protease subunit 2 isoform X3 [Pogona vitticeps]